MKALGQVNITEKWNHRVVTSRPLCYSKKKHKNQLQYKPCCLPPPILNKAHHMQSWNAPAIRVTVEIEEEKGANMLINCNAP